MASRKISVLLILLKPAQPNVMSRISSDLLLIAPQDFKLKGRPWEARQKMQGFPLIPRS